MKRGVESACKCESRCAKIQTDNSKRIYFRDVVISSPSPSLENRTWTDRKRWKILGLKWERDNPCCLPVVGKVQNIRNGTNIIVAGQVKDSVHLFPQNKKCKILHQFFLHQARLDWYLYYILYYYNNLFSKSTVYWHSKRFKAAHCVQNGGTISKWQRGISIQTGKWKRQIKLETCAIHASDFVEEKERRRLTTSRATVYHFRIWQRPASYCAVVLKHMRVWAPEDG